MTDAAQAEGTPVPAESDSAVVENQEPVEAQTEVSTPDPVSPDGEATAQTETPPSGDDSTDRKRNGFQERISQITARAKEAEERAKQAEAYAQSLQDQYEGIEVPQFPKLEDFEYDQERYHEAVATYNTAQQQATVQDALTKQQQAQAQAARQEAAQAVFSAFQERNAAFAAERPDYQQVVSNPAFQQGPAMMQAIMTSESGPAIAYHLAQNPQEAAEINSLPPIAGAMRLGQLEARLSTPPPVRTTNTPAPVEPVAPSGKAEKADEDYSALEWAKKRGYR